MQLCREIVFPEQWRYLAEARAQAFIYLTNAVNPAVPAGVWSSHLSDWYLSQRRTDVLRPGRA